TRNNFRKIGYLGKLLAQLEQELQPVAANRLVGRVHQDLVKELVDLGAQARDHILDRLAADAKVFFVQIALGTGFEQVQVQLHSAFELGLLENVADTFEAGGQ